MAADPLAAQELVRKSGQMGVPVIIMDDQVVIGFDRNRLEQLLAAAARRPSLGLAVADAARYVPNGSGAYVGRVNPGSPGERAGLRVGDIIFEFGGYPVRTADDLENLIADLSTSRIPIAWYRDNQVMRSEIWL